jgi:DNA-binding transcriptional regulator YiaG
MGCYLGSDIRRKRAVEHAAGRLTPRDLRTVGEALFGERWQSALAEALSVNDRTVRRWVAGDIAPPTGIAESLLRIARSRSGEINKAVALLERLCAAARE